MLTQGSVFAGYRIERVLGRGGMGDVYLARHPRLPRFDALKLMSEELSRNEVYRQRFSSEADIASQVQHEAVVRVYDRGEDDGRLWLAMEYVEGRDLSDILQSEGRLGAERAVALLERIASGLDAIHARGLLHRDVKPANILVTRDVLGTERALLTDFGIAKSAADSLGLTGVGDIVATLHYAAPEQFELRSGELDHRVDIYALGCVLYEMLTGRVPLQGDSVAEFWQVMQSEMAPAPSRLIAGVPPQLDAVVMKALSKNRDERYASAGELARHARAAMAAGAGYVSTPTTTPQTVDQPTIVARHNGATGPYRLTLTHPDPRAPSGTRVYGPIETEALIPADRQRVEWLIGASNFFALPDAFAGASQRASSLLVEAPGRRHAVRWNGQAPAPVVDLVRELERVSGVPPAGSYLPAPAYPGAGTSSPPERKKRRGLLLGSIAAFVVIAAAVAVALVLVLGSKKEVPGIPTAVKATAGRGTVTVSWQPGAGKTDHYVVYRDGTPIASSVSGTSYIDHLTDTQPHRFAVQAVNAKGTTSNLTPAFSVAADIRVLTSAERALVGKMPPSIVNADSCKPLPTAINTNVTLAVTCDPASGQVPTPPGKVPQVIEIFSTPSNTQLKAALDQESTSHGATSGDCSRTPEEGTWNFTETANVVNGRLICYVTSAKSYLIWSYTAQNFYVRISTTATYQSLLTYWQDASLHLP